MTMYFSQEAEPVESLDTWQEQHNNRLRRLIKALPVVPMLPQYVNGQLVRFSHPNGLTLVGDMCGYTIFVDSKGKHYRSDDV